jgi:iron complex outermembrane receptor protein
LALAVGTTANWQTYQESADAITAAADQWGGGTASTGGGNRDFQSAYVELSIPPFRGMELQAAGRVDQFSDFGSTFNPKLAFRYKPINMLMFRGSWGTGFKAPALENLYGDLLLTFPQATDPVTGDSRQFSTIAGGNPDLQEETSQAFNFGTAIEPFDNFSITMDYYQVEQNSIVSSLATAQGLRDIFRAEQQFGNAYLNQFGIDVQRASPGGPISNIIAPNVNLSRREITGMDFRVAYTPKLFASWNLNFIVDHSLLLEVLEEPFPGLGIENRAGFHGYPFWKNYITLGMANPTHSVNFIVKTIGEQNATFEAQDPGSFGKTRDHTEVDFRYSNNLPWNGTVAVGVLNLFGVDRPLSVDNTTTGAGYLNAEIYDPFGRTVYLNYTQNF